MFHALLRYTIILTQVCKYIDVHIKVQILLVLMLLIYKLKIRIVKLIFHDKGNIFGTASKCLIYND